MRKLLLVMCSVIFCSVALATDKTDFNVNEVYELINQSNSSAPREVNSTRKGERFYFGCCKVCTTGCACGDSCISCSYRCTKSVGCACDG